MGRGFEVNKRMREESEEGDLRSKNTRFSNSVDANFKVSKGIEGQEEERVENLEKGFGEHGEKTASYICELERIEFDLNFPLKPFEEERKEFDLNFPLSIMLEHDEFLPVLADRSLGLTHISLDDIEHEDVEIINSSKAQGNEVENEISQQCYNFLDLGLGLSEMTPSRSRPVAEERRYTKEEKGKGKVLDSWLSLRIHDDEQHSNPSSFKTVQDTLESRRYLELRENAHDNVQHAHNLFNYKTAQESSEHLDLRKNAHLYAWEKEHKGVSSSQQELPLPDQEKLGRSPGPFSTALKTIRERKKVQDELIKWRPSKNERNVCRSIVPSLLDLSLKVLAENCDAIVSLEFVPDILRWRLADLICDLRKMNFHILQLLVEGSPAQICLKNCSGITEEQFFKIFQKFDWKSLVVLQLDLCGQCRLDYIISHISAQLSLNLSSLTSLSLKGACCLSDDGLKALARSAPALQYVNLSECSLLTHADISILAKSWSSTLKELYINDCQKIDTELILPALKNLEQLEVLSVAGNQSVSDLFVHELVSSCGEKLKELDFANCQGLTNDSLELIGKGCANLHSLNISNLNKLTDLGLRYLADGCRNIQTLKLCRNTFSDEAIAAFLEASGECMVELSLNHVTLVGPCTAISLSKCCRMLLSLDLSWCRKITNEALGLIVDSCSMLKQVKLFGCTQITGVFLNGHSNPLVQIIGLSLTPLLGDTSVPEPHGLRLR